jgi:hypothetical protein
LLVQKKSLSSETTRATRENYIVGTKKSSVVKQRHVHFWRQRDERLTDRGRQMYRRAETIKPRASVFYQKFGAGRHFTIDRQQGQSQSPTQN